MRHNIAILALCLTLVPLAALAFSLAQTKEYSATASLLFRDSGLDQILSGSSVSQPSEDATRAAATNVRLVSLEAVASRTAKALGKRGLTGEEVASSTKVAPEGQSDVVSVTATDKNPAFATRMANTFAEEYIKFRREADRASVRGAQELVQRALDKLAPSATDDRRELRRRARELEILASVQTGNAELVQSAQRPTSPSSPKIERNVALGILLGLFLGVGLTVLREQVNRRLRDPQEVEEAFDLPILGTIPESPALSMTSRDRNGSLDDDAEQAFLMLRASLRYISYFTVGDDEVRSIVVTSAAPRDGKTTVAWNLALAEARVGKLVLYVEADLRRPILAEQLGLPGKSGLSLVLAGAADGYSATERVQGVDVLPAGPLPLNPAELMESTQMRELIRWAEQHYDRVIIDTPPAAVVGDAIPLVTEVSGVLVVVRLGKGGRDAEHLCGQLLNIEAPLLGLVVNGARRRRSEYDYSHGAHAPFAESERPDVGAPAPTKERKRSGTRQRRTKRRHAEV